MKKILIWNPFKLENVGGPSGYLYNIHEYLKQNPSDQIFFLSDLLDNNEKNKEDNSKNKSLLILVCKLLPSYIKKLYLFRCLKKILDSWLYIYNFLWAQFRLPVVIPQNINLNDYDFIHFHSMPDFLRFMNSPLKYYGKKIFTSHCPCPWTDEKLFFEKKWIKCFRPIVLHHELQCYEHADYIMFPCKESREPYEKEPKIKEILKSNENKIFYIPTGLLKESHPSDIDLNSLGIPPQSVGIGFFGRHTKMKGYDLLKDIADTLLNKHDNLYFLCAGKGEIPPPTHSHWIELGFINDVQNFLPKCDLYISPNQNTYFDLIILEVLRAGTVALLSNNGGNLFFKSLPKSEITGIDFFDMSSRIDLEEKVEKCIFEKNKNPILYMERKKANISLFSKHFTVNAFIKKYVATMRTL